MAVRTIDVTMLTALAPIAEVSHYGAALNFVDVLVVLPTLVQQALLPAFSRLHRTGQAQEIASNTLVMFSALFLPAAVGLGLLAPSLVQLYPSGQFDDAAPILSILAVGFPFVCATTVAATLLTGANRLWWVVGAYALTIPAQAVCNLLWIPEHGAHGVANATVVAHALLALLLLAAASWQGMRIPFGAIACHAVAASLMGVVVFFTRSWPILIPVVLGALSYGVTVLAIRPDSLERELARDLWLRLRRS